MKPSAIRKHRETYTDYTGVPLTEYLTLGVLFDEKDLAKSHGCKWNSDDRNWEFPSRKLDSNMLRILNERKWIVEEKGQLVDVSRWTVRSENDSHTLYEQNGQSWKFTVCTVGTDTSLTTSDREAIKVEVDAQPGPCRVSNLYTKEYAQSLWNSLVDIGARPRADAAVGSVTDHSPDSSSRAVIEDMTATTVEHNGVNYDAKNGIYEVAHVQYALNA
tara:strand:- start:289 stop:939 length:651 start_codon:yes stop_codon:yes gene_type:complete